MKIPKIPYTWRHLATLSNGAVALAVLIALSWLWGTVGTLQKNFVLQQRVDLLDQQLQVAEIENANLGFEQQYYRSQEYLELAARDRLNKSLPGEKMIILPPAPKTATESSSVLPESAEASNFQQWMRFFFGR